MKTSKKYIFFILILSLSIYNIAYIFINMLSINLIFSLKLTYLLLCFNIIALINDYIKKSSKLVNTIILVVMLLFHIILINGSFGKSALIFLCYLTIAIIILNIIFIFKRKTSV